MSKAIITPDLDAVECEILVAAPPARVFEALTDSAQLRRWWGPGGECQATLWEMDARAGGKWRFEASDPTGKIVVNGVSEFKAAGAITEFDPPRRLAYTWKANWHDRPEQPTLVRWELTAAPGGTLVKVTHSGLADLAVARTDYRRGWPGVLNYLKNFLEK
jgi:uncharacterized protein YndB with AHSA1/START domain